MFQTTLAPVIAAVEAKIKADQANARLMVYADDIVIIACNLRYLLELMECCAHHMTTMDMCVNPAKSTITPLGCSIPFPFPQGYRAAGGTAPGPSRLQRLSSLAVRSETKEALWREVILPILAYDPWTLIPSNQASKSWRTLITNSIFSALAGKIESASACCVLNPHQTDLWCILTHECMRIAFDDVKDLPPTELMRAGDNCSFQTPVTALVELLRMKKFEAQPEGLVSGNSFLIEWPPASKPECLHALRTLQREMLAREVPPDIPVGVAIDRDRAKPVSSLSQTQCNFIRTAQLNSHKAAMGNPCPFCGAMESMEHVIWQCEGRRIGTVCKAAADCAAWPKHIRHRVLPTTADTIHGPTSLCCEHPN
eukprot:1758198-Amphidinium_carterae.2